MSSALMKTENSLPAMSVGDLQSIGEVFERSGMFGCDQPGQGLVLVMTCVMANITPLEFGQTYHIIEGKPSMRADAMLAKFVERGGTYTIQERSADRAAAVFMKDKNKLEAEYTMSEAKAQGLPFKKDGKTLKANWAKFPKQMLWARLVSDTIRAIDPGVNMGTYTPEEVQDFGNNTVVPVQPMKVTKQPTEEKAEPAKAEPAKAELVEPEDVDYSVMPSGNMKGKPWQEFTDEQLEKVLKAKSKALTERHKQAARVELNSRSGEKPF